MVRCVYDMIRTRVVLYTTELQKGDHISRPTDTASGYYDHHAIVVRRAHGSVFRIIHVTDGGNGSAKKVSSCKSASTVVREEDEDFGKIYQYGTPYSLSVSARGMLRTGHGHQQSKGTCWCIFLPPIKEQL